MNNPPPAKDLDTGLAHFEALPGIAEQRRREILLELRPFADLTAAYGALVARAVWALGTVPPLSRQEEVVRDLIADVFDFLWEAERPLLEGRPHVSLPLARRAFESLSLLSTCFQDTAIADRWDKGAQIDNSEIRKALASLPFREPEQGMRELYRYFSKGTHPNRDLVAERFLGQGNQFTLGSAGKPELLVVVDLCMQLVDLWFWFGALVGHVARVPLSQIDPRFGPDYMETARRAQELKPWLAESFNGLLAQLQGQPSAEGP